MPVEHAMKAIDLSSPLLSDWVKSLENMCLCVWGGVFAWSQQAITAQPIKAAILGALGDTTQDSAVTKHSGMVSWLTTAKGHVCLLEMLRSEATAFGGCVCMSVCVTYICVHTYEYMCTGYI